MHFRRLLSRQLLFVRRHKIVLALVLVVLMVVSTGLGVWSGHNEFDKDWIYYTSSATFSSAWLPVNDQGQVKEPGSPEVCTSKCFESSDYWKKSFTNIRLNSKMRFGTSFYEANIKSNEYLDASECPNVFSSQKDTFMKCRKIGRVRGADVYSNRSVLATAQYGYVTFGSTIVVMVIVDGDDESILDSVHSLKQVDLTSANPLIVWK